MRCKGFAMLTSILIVSAILLSVGLGIHAQLRLRYADSATNYQRIQARELGLSCLEEGRYRVSRDSLFSSDTLAFSGGVCAINVTKIGNTYIMTTEARVSNIIQRFRMESETIDGTLTPTHYEQLP